MVVRWLMVIVVIFAAGACGKEPLRPTRAECLVRIEFSEFASDDAREDVVDAFVAGLDKLDVQAVVPHTPLLAVARDNRNIMYLQFVENCSARFEQADRLYEQLVSASLREKGTMRVRREKVLPGPDTADLRGPHWRDG